ncbi:MAG: hypothetical protein ACR2QO_19425 [Acidimicrobiales bacterium]
MPRIAMIGVGNLMEVIWPIVDANVGGADVASRFIGVTADETDIERKRAHFGFEMLLHDNLVALRRNVPDIIMFSPPPTIAPELIESVLRPYYEERRGDGGMLPELYAFPPVPAGAVYLDALGNDVRVVNIIPNNVTRIGGAPIVDEGFYVCTFASEWPEDRRTAVQSVFAGQGAFVELAPGQLIAMLGGAATVSSLWYAIPEVADIVAASHNDIGRLCRARLRGRATADMAPPEELLTAIIDGWHTGVRRYYSETDIEPSQTELLLDRGFDLTLHTIEEETREVLAGHSVGAATKGGVLEKAIHTARDRLLPVIEDAHAGGLDPEWRARFAALVTDSCRTVRDHGETLAG